MSTQSEEFMGSSPQALRIGGVFAVLSLGLAIAYFAFLREDYAILYDDLRLEQAAAVVEQLDAQNIPHRVRENGTQILVAQSRTGEARLSIAGSEVGRGGLSGFELFDDSDMGLTDFAQKIKYQRALQGELARTILQQEGIDQARVHISMPERSLFRGDSNPANAAVSILPADGVTLSASRIEGIQRLVAAAVPELDYRDVVVLNGIGEVISRPSSAGLVLTALQITPGATPPADAAVIDRARSIIAPVLAGLAFDVTVDGPAEADAEAPSATAGPDEADVFVGRARILTEIALTRDQEERVAALLTDEGAFEAGRVRAVEFERMMPDPTRLEARAALVQPSGDVLPEREIDTAAAIPAVALTPQQVSRLTSNGPGFGDWVGAVVWVLVLIALFVTAGLFVWRRVTTPSLSDGEHRKLADRLRDELAALDAQEAGNAG